MASPPSDDWGRASREGTSEPVDHRSARVNASAYSPTDAESLAERVNELRVRVRQIRHKAELYKKLREFIVKYERDPRTMASLEQQCRAVSAKMDRGDKQEAKEALQPGRDVTGPSSTCTTRCQPGRW